jgi:NitT/TauT family transport system substrate-binding protein
MNSDDVIGGSTTFTMMSTTSLFQSENPKVFGGREGAEARAGDDCR